MQAPLHVRILYESAQSAVLGLLGTSTAAPWWLGNGNWVFDRAAYGGGYK
jgi:hypothetical protein